MAKKRARTQRREAARKLAKLVDAKVALEAIEAGGAPDRPIEVESASQIEVHAKAMECPECGDHWQVDDHAVEVHGGRSLRVVHARSAQCGRKRRIYFVISPKLTN